LLLCRDGRRRPKIYNGQILKTEKSGCASRDELSHVSKSTRNDAKGIDRGREFVNEKLERWCKEQGIELRLTAPYSPPQNGVAERMNRMLTELARANLNSHEIPEYLWEYAISHAAYVRNCAFTKPMVTLTPF